MDQNKARRAKKRKINPINDPEFDVGFEDHGINGTTQLAAPNVAPETNEQLTRSDTEIEIGSDSENLSSGVISRPLVSLNRSITPPAGHRPSKTTIRPEPEKDRVIREDKNSAVEQDVKLIPSPFQLTRIRDLPASSNVDTIGLSDILGDPLIKQCWQFNYLFNLEFLMSAFDEDVRSLVQVKVVHGSWKREDPHRIGLEETSKRYPNVQLITAHMPEAFGTHHSKMMILFRHDDFAQVIIHTANMISQDWTNMTQAVFRTPLLPLSSKGSYAEEHTTHLFGSGEKFKVDLLSYLSAYQGRTKSLRENLKKYDFSAVKAALVASVPCRLGKNAINPNSTRWGWLGLKDVLKNVPTNIPVTKSPPNITAQVSSIATLPVHWVDSFFSILGTTAPPSSENIGKKSVSPTIKIVFPNADEIRRSLDGYQSGGSIHMKIQSAAQQKQLAHMKQFFCYWAGDTSQSNNEQLASQPSHQVPTTQREALRRRAAPHIKTYIRFSTQAQDEIDWALLTSANLSQQAWGGGMSKNDSEVRICSYEIGVCVWPALFENDGDAKHVKLVPVFGGNMPSAVPNNPPGTLVGIRMPYDLPLAPYKKGDVPWCATASHTEPDWKGYVWRGYLPKS